MIQLKEVCKRFGLVQAVAAASLEIEPGEKVIIQGPSGSGKTTLLRLIAGLELPTEGEIWIDGLLASKPGWAMAPHRRQIGVVFQRSALWPHMTVAQNLEFAMNGLSRQAREVRLRMLLAQAELTKLAQRYPDQLSGGEARRTALARALASQPRRLLLDEPLTNLDPDLKQQFLTLILEYTSQADASLVYITHDDEEAGVINGRLLRMQLGGLK